jgi:thiol-disulfide isomerase/thioredoxin
MKQILILLTSLLLISCKETEQVNTAKEIIIAGKVVDYDKSSGKNILTIYINDNGRADQLSHDTELDSTGNFRVEFERYYPQDVMISYQTNFQVIVHPGDSLYVEFNGKTRERTEIFETIKYAGDASSLNTQLSKYLKTYFETRPSSNLIHQKEKLLNSYDYKKFQDSIRLAREIRRDQFIEENKPGQELINWINSTIQFSYYEQLFDYPSNHRWHNKLPGDWKVEENYYDFIDGVKPLTSGDLICSDTRHFINRFLLYAWQTGRNNAGPIANKKIDSLIFHQIMQLSPDKGLVKQMTLNAFINSKLSRYEIAFYEQNVNRINATIKEKYLIEPIHDHYIEVKNLINNPVLASDIEVNGIDDKSAADIWQKILDDNKGKVIYIDCWATWCGPCISEFPKSNKMMEMYKGKNVAFVYLCLESNEKQWKTVLADKKLKGQHFLLNDKQGAYFDKVLKINGFPTYAIIDKKGQLIRTGNAFRPSNVDTGKIINGLL